MIFLEHTFSETTIYQIPVLTDNYIYMIARKGEAYVIDPALAEPVNFVAETKNLQIKGILNTHQHFDHVGGNGELVERWQCPVYASTYDKDRIPKISQTLDDSDSLDILGFPVQILATPGHTLGHIIYYFQEGPWAFVGDTLFSLGCGRLFEGTPQQMHSSLQKIAQLPPETTLFCTHEYTEANLNFHDSIIKDDSAVTQRAREVRKLRSQNLPSVPMTLQQELKTNLFLRTEDIQVRKALKLQDSDSWQVFAKLRKLKDSF